MPSQSLAILTYKKINKNPCLPSNPAHSICHCHCLESWLVGAVAQHQDYIQSITTEVCVQYVCVFVYKLGIIWEFIHFYLSHGIVSVFPAITHLSGRKWTKDGSDFLNALHRGTRGHDVLHSTVTAKCQETHSAAWLQTASFLLPHLCPFI